MQADILDGGPDNGQTTGLRREHINLIGALPYIAKEAFNGIGGLNMPVHHLRKRIKRQQMLFILSQAADRFWIALSVLGFEGRQLGYCLLLARLLPDANEFGLDVATFPPGDGMQHVALFMHQAALTRGGRKPLRDRREQPVLPIGHDEVDLGGSSLAQVLRASKPSPLCPPRRRRAEPVPLCCLPDPLPVPLK